MNWYRQVTADKYQQLAQDIAILLARADDGIANVDTSTLSNFLYALEDETTLSMILRRASTMVCVLLRMPDLNESQEQVLNQIRSMFVNIQTQKKQEQIQPTNNISTPAPKMVQDTVPTEVQEPQTEPIE
jgi:hypothetical protein